MHMLKQTDPWFDKFGEIYFSTVHPGIVKGWHKHTSMDLNYVCVYGKIKLVVSDGLDFQEFFLSPESYNLITIPHGLWNGFKGLGTTDSIVANCATLPHDPDEIIRVDPNSTLQRGVPYSW